VNYPYTPVELGPIEQMHALRRLFGADAALSHEALAGIAQLTRAQRVAADVVLAREGEPFPFVYFIIEGQLELSRDGKRVGLFGAGNGVGVMSALARDEAGFGCRTLQESTLLVLRMADLFEMMEDYFELMHGALRNVAAEAIRWRNMLPDGGFVPHAPVECLECGSGPLGLVERIFHLRRTIGLERSYIDELAELARSAREVRVPRDTSLWSIGERADHLLIVVRGNVAGRTREGGVFHFGPGDILGNLDTISGEPRWFDARVESESDLVGLAIDSEVIVDVWEDHPELGFAFLRMLSRLILELRVRAAGLQLDVAAAQ
jgi:CRP-like cAMP-binding protein